ncbi:MAG: efflux RND transporter periplasmic adaptor subunit [Lachnospiraceae bacterium]|nr:efflux RND transporter periplasmic adaptor subunit [Lachnospiraceae bacterium]
MKKRFLALFLVSAFALSCLSGCDNNKGKTDDAVEEESLLPVDTISAEKGTLVISETFMGNVSAGRELKVYPKTSGEVTRINVKPGDYVNAGDLLFKLNDDFAQLDLESAQSALNRTQAEVKKSLGSEQVLSQQMEWQGLENQASRIADSSYSLTTAKEDYDRQQHYLGEAQDRENKANDEYKKASDKYDKANRILKEYEKLQAAEPGFSGKTLTEAAGMDPSEGPSQENIDKAKKLAALMGGDNKLTDADITPAGVEVLAKTKDSLESVYTELKTAKEMQEDKVTAAKRNVDMAGKSLQDNYVTYRQDVDNMMVKDISILADNRKIGQIEIDASSINVEKAKQSLELYTVTAPISGYIGKVGIKEYETVSAGVEAILIENTDSMTVEFMVTEKVRNNLTEGQSLSVEKDDIKVNGDVIEISEVPDEQSGLFKIKAEIPGTSGIISGTRVSVTLESYKDDSGFVVPNDAVYHANGQEYIYVAKNGNVVKRNVVTGLFDTDRIVISEGLSAGEHVITSWTSELKEGVKVQETLKESPIVTIDPADGDTSVKQDSTPAADTSDAGKQADKEAAVADSDDTVKQSKVRATTTVFIRSAPDKDDDNNKLGKANEGDEFSIIGTENGWTKVVYNDSEAYIKSDYLKEVSDAGEAE